MSNTASNVAEAEDTPPKEDISQVPVWLRATLDDLQGLDFEAPIRDLTEADCHALNDHLQAAAHSPDKPPKFLDTPAARVHFLLAAVTGMHFKPHDQREPFGAMMIWSDGQRSALPVDFIGHVNMLSEMAANSKHPVLRARLADLCWTLDRKKGQMGKLAIGAYTEIIERADKGEFQFRFEKKGVLHHDARNYLRRALQIARQTGWDKDESLKARQIVIALRQRAVEQPAPSSVLQYSDLDMDFLLSDPAEVAGGIEKVLSNKTIDAKSHLMVELWRLCTRAYHNAKKDADKHRCQAEAAEHLAREAAAVLANNGSSMVAAHWLSSAIAQLHGIPDKKERRTELRHKLIDVQAGAQEEMTIFHYPMDLEGTVGEIEKAIENLGLIDKLFFLARLPQSPDPADLVKQAQEAIQHSPIASLFETSHIDDEGKVIHRSAGGHGNNPNDEVIQRKISEGENIRRKFIAFGQIQPVRHSILNEHFLSEDFFAFMLQHSPFVPADLIATYSRGFIRFIQGDFTSALYILTPLLENSLRHVLKSSGHDVTIFDDATKTQEDRTISSLFEQMRGELEKIFQQPIITDLENVFLSKTGPHLRHSLAHGLLHDGTPYGSDAIYACCLILRLCLIPLFKHREQFKSILED
jgi:hypothetical protein